MSVEGRFQVGFREEATDEPGLALEDDGTVQLVAPDGSRSALASNGGSLPSQWTVDENGNIEIAPSADSLQGGNVRIIASPDSNDALVVTDSTNPTGINFGVDPFGFISGAGIDIGATADVVALRAAGFGVADGQTRDTMVSQSIPVGTNHYSRFRHAANGDVIIEYEGQELFKVEAADGSVHIQTGTAVIADL